MKIFLLSVPYDAGHHQKRLGAGPLKLASTLGKYLEGKDNMVRNAEVLLDTNFPTEVTASFQLCRKISAQVHEAIVKGELPIILAGNCTTSIGTLGGLQSKCGGVVWFDCHGDFNTPETTIGGSLDGMSLSIVAGHCWKQLSSSVPGFMPIPENKIVLIGARDFDNLEIQLLSPSAIRLITPEMVKENSYDLENCFLEMESVYLHIDLDVLDPEYVRAKAGSTDGGLLPDNLYEMISVVMKRCKISAIAFTGYDPSMDPDHKIPKIVNQIISVITG